MLKLYLALNRLFYKYKRDGRLGHTYYSVIDTYDVVVAYTVPHIAVDLVYQPLLS